MHPIYIVLIILASLTIGSFLNVVIVRLPKGESPVSGRSHCPSCGKKVRFYDNIPLFSFLILNGKCRDCHAPISWRYPVVEALTALTVLGLLTVYGLSASFLLYGILICFLIPIAFIDLETGFIPDKLLIPAFILGVGVAVGLHIENWMQILIGAFSGGILLTVFAVLGKWLFKKDSMGMGDIKLLVIIGCYIGFPGVWISLFLGAFIGSILVLAGMILKKIHRFDTIPFGPFIALGTLTYLYGGVKLVQWYMSLFS